MIRFLYWNTHGKPLEYIRRMARRYEIDILILGECTATPGELLRLLNSSAPDYHYPHDPNQPTGVAHIVTRYPLRLLVKVFYDPDPRGDMHVSIWKLALPARPELLLAIIHGPSKRERPTEAEQAAAMRRISKIIVEEENRAGHSRTVLVGDLNMNPFESGVCEADALHGVMDKAIIAGKAGKRIYLRDEYSMFYNPMWSHFGDARGPSGTYYYESSAHKEYFWNIYDQVLVRPELMPLLGGLKIMTSDGTKKLVKTNGRPNESISDHLPIRFELRI